MKRLSILIVSALFSMTTWAQSATDSLSLNIPTSASDSIYMAPNVNVAEFSGGMEGMRRYLAPIIRVSDPGYKRLGLQGRLLITFVVEKDGSTSQARSFKNDLKPTKTAASLHLSQAEFDALAEEGKAYCEEMAIEAILSIRNWQPAIHQTDGKKEYVRMQMTLPIIFKP